MRNGKVQEMVAFLDRSAARLNRAGSPQQVQGDCGKGASVSVCFTCGKPVARLPRAGLKLFCNRICFGLSRRKEKSVAQKKAEKRLYDMQYRKLNAVKLKTEKAAWFKHTYDPKKARVIRHKNMARHVEYCRRPEYRAWKSQYDAAYRAKKDYGPFWEAAMLLVEIDNEIGQRATNEELAFAKGTVNKAQTRRREYESILKR